ncbi:MAG: RNA methyltransferase [Patescibacteria group bacterium]
MGRSHNNQQRINPMPEDREERIDFIKRQRWQDLELIVEQVDDPHNVGAILRTCDAVGIQTVHLVYAKDKQVRLSELKSTSAASAVKWLTLKKWDSLEECYKDIKSRGLKICVTALDPKGKAHFDLDFKAPCAILMGNEKDGATQYAIQNAEEIIAIPMRGFVQSLNVSVAAAVVMYEALRQRITPSC